MIIPKNLLRQNVQTVRHSNTEDVYLTKSSTLAYNFLPYILMYLYREKESNSIMKLNVSPLYVKIFLQRAGQNFFDQPNIIVWDIYFLVFSGTTL